MALVRGDIEKASEPVLVRMHSHCVMGDVFGSTALRLPRHHRRLDASDCRGRTRRADLPASDVEGIFSRENRRHDAILSSIATALCRPCRKVNARRSAKSALARRFCRT